MHKFRRVNASVNFFMNELTSRIVAESGIPSDRFHLGKIILQSLKDAPDSILQIDGATGEKETCGSVLERSIQCANSLRTLGFKRGDMMILMAPNHLDLCIPFYAALYLGIIASATDYNATPEELVNTFKKVKPNLLVCQSEKVPEIQTALKEARVTCSVIPFNKGSSLPCLSEILKKHGGNTSVEEFKAEDLDSEDAISVLVPTSGTTNVPKLVTVTHKNIASALQYFWARYTQFPTPTRMVLIIAPLQWLTSLLLYCMSVVMRYTRLQSALPMTQKYAYHLINTYKPTFMLTSPTLMTMLIKPSDHGQCDFTCFESINIGGSAVPLELINDVKKITPKTEVTIIYGLSEIACPACHPNLSVPESCGTIAPHLQFRLINVETKEDIVESNVPGELWLKGPSIFKGYYDNPEATKAVFSEDGWLKTGDKFYSDDNCNLFFVERLSLFLEYKTYLVSPAEVENVIRKHPSVLDVAVTGVRDPVILDLIIACVVRRPGCDLTADEVKDLVKESLPDSHQLRGGVVFLNEIPMTVSTKIDRRKLKEMVLNMKRE